jgi:hypothetical protein
VRRPEPLAKSAIVIYSADLEVTAADCEIDERHLDLAPEEETPAHGSAAADHRDDLDAVALGKGRRRVLGARDDLAVLLDGDPPSVDAEDVEERRDGGPVGDVARVAVDEDVHRRRKVPAAVGRPEEARLRRMRFGRNVVCAGVIAAAIGVAGLFLVAAGDDEAGAPLDAKPHPSQRAAATSTPSPRIRRADRRATSGESTSLAPSTGQQTDDAARVLASESDRAARLPQLVHDTLTKLVAAKAAERDNPATPDPPSGRPRPGTFDAARKWLHRDAYRELWSSVMKELEFKPEQSEAFWKGRTSRESWTATYGGGSFIVLQKAPDERSVEEAERLEGADWWDAATGEERAAWLVAHFVETSGMFTVIAASQTPCAACDGRGRRGGATCRPCNGCGKFRSVSYR